MYKHKFILFVFYKNNHYPNASINWDVIKLQNVQSAMHGESTLEYYTEEVV